MVSLLKIAAILTVVTALGALQFAVPLFSDSDPSQLEDTVGVQTKTKLALNLTYETETGSASAIKVEDYSDVEQGSLFFRYVDDQATQYQLSPLLDTQLKLNVTGMVARAKLTQTFSNQSEEWVNGLYVFPLPTGAAVDHLEMQIGDRRIEGQIHPKKTAKRIYQQAKREGKKAGLLEQQRPNLFTSSVANIGPGEQVEITIEYQQLVRFENGQFQLRFPMTVTPRYNPQIGSQSETRLAETNPNDEIQPNAAPVLNNKVQNPVNITVHIDAGFELSEIQSESHTIRSQKLSEWIYLVELDQQAVANRDFILNWRVNASKVPQAAHFTQAFNGEHYGLLMVMPPTVEQSVEYLPKQLTFVLDTSGSMAGEPLRQAKKALRYAVRQLSERDSFNVIEFNSYAKALWSYSRYANVENKQSAIDFINALESNGGTNMQDALNLALRDHAQAEDSGIGQVVFITDGSVSNDTQLLSFIRDNLKDKRLFTVGIGAAPNGYFMQEAAVAGKGSFTFIGSVVSVDEKMQNLFDRIRFPVLTDLVADVPNDIEMFPTDIPDLYAGEPLILTYKGIEPVAKVYVSGQSHSASWSAAINTSSGTEQVGLNVLWARKKIEQLSRDRLVAPQKEGLNREIEQVALQHHLVSEFTSLVAVDVTPVALATSRDQQVANNAPETAKQQIGILPHTATDAEFRFYLGLLLLGVSACFYLRQSPAH